jgi:ABC-type long-subunit fatty acid transport system fused permease/ATPase subunit
MSLPNRLAASAATARRIWALAAPYFRSEERWKARGLLAAIVALNLAAVYVSVQITNWNRVFYDALQARDAPVFWHQVGVFALLAFAFVLVAVYRFYLTQLIELRWRAWLTRDYLQRWLQHQAFYRMELARFSGGRAPDNPDQRIQEDLQLFTEYSVSLSMGMLNALVSLASFTGILWALSGSFSFDLAGGSYAIPGYMVWAALAYCIGGSVVTHYIGRPQIRLNFSQQRLEADFRHHMVRVREYSEAIALDRGEAVERGHLELRFSRVLLNYLQLLRARKNLTWFTAFFGQAAVVFPLLLAGPRFLSGAIQLGELMQIASAFGEVQDALSWFVDNYSSLAAWRATSDRLTSFEQSVAQQEATAHRRFAGHQQPGRGASQWQHPAVRRGRVGRARRPRLAARSLRQRQVVPAAHAGRHLAVRARTGHAAGRCHGDSAAAVLPGRAAARCARVPRARVALRRCRPEAGAARRAAAATRGAPGRRGRLEPEALWRRAPAAGAGPRVPEEPALGPGRRSHLGARRSRGTGPLRTPAGAHRSPAGWTGLHRPPALAGSAAQPPLGSHARAGGRQGSVLAAIGLSKAPGRSTLSPSRQRRPGPHAILAASSGRGGIPHRR